MTVTVDFYYGLGSRYSYLAATQIEGLEQGYDVSVDWHPLTSGALMDLREQNPFHGEPSSGQYDWDYRQRDAEDWADFYGVPFIEPVGRLEFDRDMPALACVVAKRLGAVVDFSHEMFRMIFAQHRDSLTHDDAIAAAEEVGFDRQIFAELLSSDGIRAEHDRDLAIARDRGTFGVPTFFVGGRMFWGNDRLPLVRAVLEGKI